jgi:2,4-dienoyl-CoA reductase-like NADH-dependent reductase (Old Yellow Enzyme family)
MAPHFPPPPARWPTAEEAGQSLLFSPIAVGRLPLEQRTWVPAMVPWRATEEGHATPALMAWYGRMAEGRPGAIVVEATGIRDIPSGPLLRIGDDRFLPGLSTLAAAIHERSGGHTRALIQVLDFLTIRRRPQPEVYFGRHLALQSRHRERLAARTGEPGLLEAPEAEVRSRILDGGPALWRAVLDPREQEDLGRGYRERVTDLHLQRIRELPRVLPDLFAAAAQRAFRAGFDGVELHYAHAYTMASFLSLLNDRDDGYGGDLEGRLRLPLEVLAAVRAAVGQDACVGLRMLADEAISGGFGAETAAEYAARLAAAGADFISLSRGGKFEDARTPRVGEAVYPYTGPSGLACMPTSRAEEPPYGRNVPIAALVRRRLRTSGLATPVVAAGGLCMFDQMEAILRRGEADIVAAARQTLADPDFWRKMREGAGAEIRRCTYTSYCEGLDQRHKEVTCRLWDKDLDAPGAELRSSDGSRRLVAPPWRHSGS